MLNTKKFATAIATGAVLMQAMVPFAYAETNLVISGNGSNSDSTLNVSNSNSTTVAQTNTATVVNTVNSNASTGGNRANDNTGGDVAVRSGNADNRVEVSNNLNMNVADVNGCGGCEGQDMNVTISGNGTGSNNDVDVNNDHSTELYQTNNATVYNTVDANSRTGGNDANRNTGGDVLVRSGDASSTVILDTTANANWARIGGSNGNNNGSLDIMVSGNGSNSDNTVNFDSNPSVTLVQDNNAVVTNDVDANAKTGYNDANDNTGGDVAVVSGDADVEVLVDNMVNFNAADVDCGCVSDIMGKISGNGTGSDNDIDVELGDELEVFQDGNGYLANYLDGDAKTGENDSNRNVGEAGSDPFVMSGDADSFTGVSNSGNVNVYGSDVDLDDFDFEFDLEDLFGGLWHWIV
jgi:hypothetical protein